VELADSQRGRGRGTSRAVQGDQGGVVVHSGGWRPETRKSHGGSELGHGGHSDLAQGSGAPVVSKPSKACAWEGEGVSEVGGAHSCDRDGLKHQERQRRRELCSLVHGGHDHEQQQRERESARKWRRMARSSSVRAGRGRGVGTRGSKARRRLTHGGHVGSTCHPKGQFSE
jgi:hypothetical protein